MLTEIYCSAFGKEKVIPFTNGLNIIQGYKGNSIGKSTALKIVDYAFGGKYYADSNDDIIKNVGSHDICFSHTFNGKTYRFRRNSSTPKKVICCKDDAKYTPDKDESIDDFNAWLKKMYGFQEKPCKFREIVGLYSRIWNKPNKEVNRPLYYYSNQPVTGAIVLLVKLFNKYGPISEIVEHTEYLKKRRKALNEATEYHIISSFSSKTEYNKACKEIEQLKEKQKMLELSFPGINAEALETLNNDLATHLERRILLQRQQGRLIRQKAHIENNLQQLEPIELSCFKSLEDFFPNINTERLNEVQEFHSSLQAILHSELYDELCQLDTAIGNIHSEIEDNEAKIKEITKVPVTNEEILLEYKTNVSKILELQNKITAYEEAEEDKLQLKEAKNEREKQLTSITKDISDIINEKIKEFSIILATENSKAPELSLSANGYSYGVKDNTGTGKAYTDLILFDLAILATTDLPILIHDSFLFNNISEDTIQHFIEIYSKFSNKQVFISLDKPLSESNEEITKIMYKSTRLVLSDSNMLFCIDWRTETEN